MKKSKYLIVVFIISYCLGLHGQVEPADSIPIAELIETINTEKSNRSEEDIKVISKGTATGLQIRWAPVNPETWEMGAKYGYTLERDTSAAGNYEPVGPGLFKPWAKEGWMPYTEEEHKYVQISAQCIFGESMAQEGFVHTANELSIRHAFNLFAADMDKVAAEASGLSYFEPDTSSATYAKYRIYTFDPVSKTSSDTTYLIMGYFGIDQFFPPSLEIEEADQAIKLRWRGGGHFLGASALTAYHIERSTDGQNFIRLLPDAFLNATSALRQSNELSTYIDSVDNGITYYYRVVGVDAFADETEPSNVVSGAGKDLAPPSVPYELTLLETVEQKLNISWEWEDLEQAGDLAGFNVYRAPDLKSTFMKVNEKMLGAEERSFIHDDPDTVDGNYYYVQAVDVNGNEAASINKSFWFMDDTSPDAPTGLSAEIDSAGVVLLEWVSPPNPDVMGYEIFYANHEQLDFIKMNTKIIKRNHFVDKLSLATLTKERYYKVVAVDFHYNRSTYSEMTMVERPDTIAPVASIFKSYQVSEEGIGFTWVASTSEDVESIKLNRRTASSSWEVVPAFDSSTSTFTDKTVEAGTQYEYTLLTKDGSGNISYPKKGLVLEAVKSFYLEHVKALVLNKKDDNMMLSWSYPTDKDYHFIIYQEDSEGDLVMIKKLKSRDSYIFKYKRDTKYTFAVKVQSMDGRSSQLSKSVVYE